MLERNYNIKYNEAEPTISFQPNTSKRVSLIYKYTNKQNRTSLASEEAIIQKGTLEYRQTIHNKGNLMVKFSLADVQYNKEESSAIGFEMLESLSKGNNYIWNIILEQNLTSNTQLNFQYEGRKGKEPKAIQQMSVQFRMFF